jgi:prepilin-type N-terminal cleavage/methylation domain-containing protein
MKKGVTLIELVIVLAIISMTFIALPKFLKIAKQYENEIKTKCTGNSIMIFINEARQYCKGNNFEGYIQGDILENTLEFYNNSSRVSVYKPPEGIKITKFLTNSYNKIRIDKNGSTSNAGTVTYRDMYGKPKEVTIRVGSEYVHVYD